MYNSRQLLMQVAELGLPQVLIQHPQYTSIARLQSSGPSTIKQYISCAIGKIETLYLCSITNTDTARVS